jgi:hypothetical protein
VNEDKRVTNMLMNTDDAAVWAREFMRIIDPRSNVIDEGVMIGWFANAMQAGINQYERRRLRAAEELGSSNIFEGDTNDL